MARRVSPKTTPRLSSLFRTHLIRNYIPSTTNNNNSNHSLEKTIQTQCLSGKLINLEEAFFYLDCLASSNSHRPFPPSCLNVSRFNSLAGKSRPDILLRCFCLLRRPDLALSVLAPMIKLALGPRARALTELIRALFASSDSPLDALRVFQRAEKDRLVDEFTYSVVIHGLCKAGQTSKAVELLRRVPCPDAACFAPVIDSLCRNDGDAEAALKLFDEMSESGVAANEVVLTSLAGGLCRLGRWDEAKKLLIDAKVCAGEEAYNAAVDSLFKSGRPREAMEAFEAMVRARVRPTEVTLTSLVCGLARCGRCDDALQLFRARPGSTVAALGAVSRALCRAGRAAEAMRLVEANRGGVRMYNRILNECFGSGKWREGFEVAERMRWRGVEPDVVTFTVIAAALGEQGRVKEAVSLFKDMVVRGFVPDRAVRAVLRSVLARRPKGRFAMARHRRGRGRSRREAAMITDVYFRRRRGSWW